MSQTFSFNQERISDILKKCENGQISAEILSSPTSASISKDVFMLAECTSVTVDNGVVCLNLPLGFGRQCIDIPRFIPNGEVARACLSIIYRTVLGVSIPIGVKVCIFVANQEITCVEFRL